MFNLTLRTDIANASTMALSPSVLAPYREAYEYAMVPNWDNDGAVSLTPGVVRLAASLIGEYGALEHLVEIGPGRDGSLSFVWEEGGSYIYLDVGPEDTVHLYRDVAEQRWEGVSVASDPRILERISSAFRDAGWIRPAMVVFTFMAEATNTARWGFPAFR
jgi:hypothetical protein